MSEEFYDSEIAPMLAELGAKCEAKGIPFLALVEYDSGKVARTEFIPTSAGIGQRIATWAARADGNVDTLMLAIQRHATKHGHSSAILHMLGIKERP